jgi:hypothetical protein
LLFPEVLFGPLFCSFLDFASVEGMDSLTAFADPEEEAPTEGFCTVVKLEIFC